MFSTMRNRLIASIGMRSISLEDLAQCELESIDSMPLSIYSNSSDGSVLSKLGLKRQSSASVDLCDCSPKAAVVKVLKMIKQLNQVQTTKNMNIMTFLEMLQMQFYKNVSLSMIHEFIKSHQMIPKPIYFHYYIYFLHYAEYYHFTRGVIDIIDPSKVEFHLDSLSNIRTQLKYIYHSINNKPSTEITL